MAPSLQGVWPAPNQLAQYDKKTPCQPVASSSGEVEINIDDSWLVVPHELPQAVLAVGDALSRCSLGADGCVLPTLTTSSASRMRTRRRRLGEENSTADSMAFDKLARHALDEGTEDDDHIKEHEEAPVLPDLDTMPAYAPRHTAPAPLGQLRSALGSNAPGHGRRTSNNRPQRWSAAATWGATWNGTHFNGDICFIPNGTHILLDVASVYVRFWVIEGRLTLADELDISVGAEAIIINHGELHVGSAMTPFSHKATITLHGHWQSAQLPVFGIKLIGLTQGKIFMYGQPKTSFLRLVSTAAASSRTVTLVSAPSGWQVGDRLIITSSGHDINCTMLRDDACQTEEVGVLAVNGATVTLSGPLRYTHDVRTHSADGRTITLACEVVNLNRNVRILGSSGTGTAGFGGHVMLLHPTSGESAFHHVELFRMGQAMRVGRYPLHLHAVTEQGGVGDVSQVSDVGVGIRHSGRHGVK